ncbi:hypothetical protein KIN20_016598 [Parelaphostrongylus tenuis]|uniref:Uncharacterized protein n=1 Tax=Parelaphostrongylus tenuis TaxID=148309 RepID=A0AAD5N5E9_PARTN|nr:hypothetical protein KIN20_016598 [Parelaphostrongylus tenuis]
MRPRRSALEGHLIAPMRRWNGSNGGFQTTDLCHSFSSPSKYALNRRRSGNIPFIAKRAMIRRRRILAVGSKFEDVYGCSDVPGVQQRPLISGAINDVEFADAEHM